MKKFAFAICMAASILLAVARPSFGQDITVPGSWPSLNGDNTGKRFSPLTQINQGNVAKLAPAWTFNVSQAVKSTPIMVDGTVYVSAPEKVWALDAKSGKQLWVFSRTAPGDHLGNRGVAIYKGRVYWGTPDAFLVALDAKTGKEIWEKEMADVRFGYYMSGPPLVVKNKLIVDISGDASDVVGFLKSVDPETGKVLWTWNSVPKWGEPGSETWPNKEAMLHGGGTTWVQGSYDPSTNLIYWGTGNPHPVDNGLVRAGNNLYTCSIVAIHADTGKLAWYFQPSPHDTADRDATESVVMVDGMFNNKPRKMLIQASRNGFFVVLDRVTGESLLTRPYGPQNWSSGLSKRNEPIPDPAAEPARDGTLLLDSGTNWYVPSYDPQTQLFYVNANLGAWSMRYLTYAGDGRQLEDHIGGRGGAAGRGEAALLAIDYKTGDIKWKLDYGNASGILTTAGKLLFTSNSGYLVGLDPATGKTLWKYNDGGPLSNGPMTYERDGRQYVLLAAQSKLIAFALAETGAKP